MSAVISECGLYRYELRRTWHECDSDLVTFIMLNPSTADAEQDDPTIRRCIGFAKMWGYGRLAVLNLFAWRATKPADLWDAADYGGMDIIGPKNDAYIEDVTRESALVVCAWGNGGRGYRSERVSSRGRRDSVVNYLRATGIKLHAIQISQEGEPCHPLYLRKAQEPQLWA